MTAGLYFLQTLSASLADKYDNKHRATGEELNVDLDNAKRLEINNYAFSEQQYTIVELEFGDVDGMISLHPFRNTPHH